MALSYASGSLAMPAQSIAYSAAPALSVAAPAATVRSWIAAPAQSIAYSAAPAITAVAAAPAITAVAAAPVAAVNLQQWSDYSPEPVQLGLPALPAPDYRCYAPPQVPPGQTRFLKVDEPTGVKNLEQNFSDVRTAVRENNTHLQRNKTFVTNINRNHNHLLRIVTNENNYEHNLVNKIVRVGDTHRQRIENVKGETRNFRDFKQTQRLENLGCRRADLGVVAAAPALIAAAPARTVVAAAAPAIATPIEWSAPQALSIAAGQAATIRSARLY
jgi:hypothetical protein